jgi:predicted secreted Zn-dependent protease
MYCPECGHQNSDDALFCLECGAGVTEEARAQKAQSRAGGWCYAKRGAPLGRAAGPLTWGELVSLASSGRLQPVDSVWDPRLSQWVPAGQVSGLFGAGAVSPAWRPGAQAPGRAAVPAGRKRGFPVGAIVALVAVGVVLVVALALVLALHDWGGSSYSVAVDPATPTTQVEWEDPLGGDLFQTTEAWPTTTEAFYEPPSTSEVTYYTRPPEPQIYGASVQSYEIQASTSAEIAQEIEQHGPSDAEGRWAGYTAWYMSWNWPRDSGGNAILSQATVDCDITVTLPHWDPPASTSVDVIVQWDDFYAGLVAHEQHHVDIVLGYVPAALAAVRQASNASAANTAAQAVLDQIRRDFVAFDSATQHGTL